MASRCTHKKQIPFPIVRRSNGDCQTGSSPGSVHRSPAPSQSAPVTSCRFAPLTVAGPRRLLPASLFNHARRRWYLFLHINFPKINFGSILRQTSAPVKRMSATSYDICLRRITPSMHLLPPFRPGWQAGPAVCPRLFDPARNGVSARYTKKPPKWRWEAFSA